MNQVTVTISGPVGSGKSAIAGEIEIMCKALDLQVEWVNGDSEKNLTGADWTGALEMYKPTVRIVEAVATTGHWANAATTGEGAIAASLGIASKAKASAGGAIVVCHRLNDGELIAVRAAMVGADGVKPDVWYVLDANGEFVEVPE